MPIALSVCGKNTGENSVKLFSTKLVACIDSIVYGKNWAWSWKMGI